MFVTPTPTVLLHYHITTPKKSNIGIQKIKLRSFGLFTQGGYDISLFFHYGRVSYTISSISIVVFIPLHYTFDITFSTLHNYTFDMTIYIDIFWRHSLTNSRQSSSTTNFFLIGSIVLFMFHLNQMDYDFLFGDYSSSLSIYIIYTDHIIFFSTFALTRLTLSFSLVREGVILGYRIYVDKVSSSLLHLMTGLYTSIPSVCRSQSYRL